MREVLARWAEIGTEGDFAWGGGRTMQCAADVLLNEHLNLNLTECKQETILLFLIITPFNLLCRILPCSQTKYKADLRAFLFSLRKSWTILFSKYSEVQTLFEDFNFLIKPTN